MMDSFMRKLYSLIFFAVIGVTSVHSDEPGLDNDLMQNIEDTNKSLSSNIALQRADASKSDANDLKLMFDIVEAHFVKKGNANDAVDLSKKSINLATEIIQSVDSNNFDKASNSATELSRACKSCHTFYKKE